MHRIAALVLLLFVASLASAQDKIPYNCSYPDGSFYQQNWVLRLHPGMQTVTIADWSTGETVRVIESLPDMHMRPGAWSPSCRYIFLLYTGVLPSTGYQQLKQTAIYDVVDGREVSRFPESLITQVPVKWSPDESRVLVETRFGAFVHTLGGGDVWLTSQGGPIIHSFRRGSVVWDLAQNTISGRLDIAPYGQATYDLGSGQLLALTDSAGTPLDPGAADYTVHGRPNGEKYRCFGDHIEDTFVHYSPGNKQLVLHDSGTADPLRVLATDVEYTLYRNAKAPVWSDNCTKLTIDFSPNPVTFDLASGTRTVHGEE